MANLLKAGLALGIDICSGNRRRFKVPGAIIVSTCVWETLKQVSMILVFGTLAISPASAADRLVFSTFEDSHLSAIGGLVIKKAYAKLGIEAEVYETSGSRSLVLSSTGHVDGEVIRIREVEDRYPSLLRTRTPTVLLEGMVFIRQDSEKSLTLENLPQKHVGHLVGAVHAELFTEGFSNVWTAPDEAELFRLLAAGKLDAVVSDRIDGGLTIAKLRLPGIVPLGRPFQVEPLYHYLHTKHRALLPRIEAVLADMHASGEVDTIVNGAIAGGSQCAGRPTATC